MKNFSTLDKLPSTLDHLPSTLDYSPSILDPRPKGKLAQKPCGLVGKSKYHLTAESAPLFVVAFDENFSPFLSFLDYSYWPVEDLELAFRDAANVHTGKKRSARLFKSEV